MPRRLILSATERDTLLALPESQDDLIRYYTFNDSDLSLIRQRRGDANRLGFAVQLCLLRYPGYALGTDSELPEPVILWVAKQVQAEPASWAKYGERDVTRREHAQELRTYLQLALFGLSDFRALVRELTELAQQTDKGLLLAGQALESLRQKRRILPALSVIDRACSGSHCASQSAGLPRPGRTTHGLASGQAGRAVEAQGRQQHHLVDLAAPGTAETQLSAHAGTHRAAEDISVGGLARRPGPAHPPEPPAQAGPRGWADDAQRPR
ncbi:DUF4158 domain-containing protein [Klebsiella pneumoniae]|uniref:DUF4158 domain-containing protein n=1 Tax=Klebsiella pneumoniae TaxID=573 RepID=UPI003DA8846E